MAVSLANYLAFLRTSVRVPVPALPDNSPWIQWTYNYALQIVNVVLKTVPGPPSPPSPPASPNAWTLYDLAVYNLATDTLINWCPDQAGQTYFVNARTGFEINTFVAGVVQSTGDESTNESLLVPDFFKGLTMSDLQLLKTPYGRFYLSIAQKTGPIWGLS